MQSKHYLNKFQALGCGLCFVRCFAVKVYILILFLKRVFLLSMTLSQGFCEVSVHSPRSANRSCIPPWIDEGLCFYMVLE